jgi:hypothetical protein
VPTEIDLNSAFQLNPAVSGGKAPLNIYLIKVINQQKFGITDLLMKKWEDSSA